MSRADEYSKDNHKLGLGLVSCWRDSHGIQRKRESPRSRDNRENCIIMPDDRKGQPRTSYFDKGVVGRRFH